MPYKSLQKTLNGAFDQASKGKGKERHAGGLPFTSQPIFWIEENFKSFQLGQAVKKVHESQILPTDRAIAELEGAIVFIASHIIYLHQKREKENKR
jgi:hypothetical protein